MILQWHEVGVKVSAGKFTERTFIFGPCLLIRYSNGRSGFYAPDGKRFGTEKLLIKHMDKKYGLQKSGGDCKAAH